MAATTGPLQSTHRTPVHRSPCVEPVLRPRILRRRSDHRRKSHASPGLETGAIQFNSELEGWRPQVAVTSRSQKLKPPNEQRSREEARDGADAHVSPRSWIVRLSVCPPHSARFKDGWRSLRDETEVKPHGRRFSSVRSRRRRDAEGRGIFRRGGSIELRNTRRVDGRFCGRMSDR